MNNIVLQKTWVQGRPVVVDNLLGTAFTGEAGAHTFKIRGVDAAQETVTISGTITGKLLAANNVTISMSGSIEDGCAVVTLTDECYDVPGRFIFSVYATSGSTTLCLYCAVGNVLRTDSQVIAYPTESLPNITSLMADLEQILADWPADYSQLQSDVSSLKSAISEQTYNLVTGAMDSMTINGSGRLVAGTGTMLFYAPVVAGENYTVLTNETSLVCGFIESVPTAGAYLYNNQRIIQTSMTIQATITGYLVCRAVTPISEYQIVKGADSRPYMPSMTAVDYVARNDVDAIDNTVKNEVFDNIIEIYTDKTDGQTLSDYTLASFYSVADIPAGYTLNSVTVQAPSGSAPYMALIYNDNGYKVELLRALSVGTGEDVTDMIDYVTEHDCSICIAYGFRFVVDATQPLPMMYGLGISDGQYVVGSASQGRSGIAYAVTITASAPSLEGRINSLADTLIEPCEMASALSMFETIGVCGDSYAEGVIVTSNAHPVNHYMSWGKNLERQMGNSVTLYAKSGVKAGDYITDSQCLPALVADTARQLYIISLGHNDMYNHTAKATFVQNYYTIIDAIVAHAPNAKIILCRQSRPYADFDPALNTAIDEIAEHYGLPVLDPENDPYTSSDVWLDTMVSRHPTFAGYAGMAQAINRQFARATVEYFDYFKEYAG